MPRLRMNRPASSPANQRNSNFCWLVCCLCLLLLNARLEAQATSQSKHPSSPQSTTSTDDRDSLKQQRIQILKDAKRIVFLGDSITYAGGYVSLWENWLLQEKLQPHPLVINVGLPSETVSGLSEEGHAGGQFPRPDLAERLDRVLEKTKPDLVIACYGMNCGIYQPKSKATFEAYQAGMKQLRNKVMATGAKFIVVTPPIYDDQKSSLDFSYNQVLDDFSQWLVQQKENGWTVIDLHSAMNQEVTARRQDNPDFSFQPDAVHPNADGHRWMAEHLIGWFQHDPDFQLTAASDSEKIIHKRMEILRDAYLTAAKHNRPGIAAGLAVPAAETQAKQLLKSIDN